MVWQVCYQGARPAALTAQQWECVCHSGSLTAYLKNKWPDIDFRLLSHGVGEVLAEEADFVGVSTETTCWVRQIAWYFFGHCWIVARVIIPQITDAFADLTVFGNRSIGDILFDDPPFEPGVMEIAALDSLHFYHQLADDVAGGIDSPMWARRRCFSRGGHRLLVSECFLPSFMRALLHV